MDTIPQFADGGTHSIAGSLSGRGFEVIAPYLTDLLLIPRGWLVR
jgi:hypothetical protein